MILSKKQTIAIDYLEDKTTNELLFGGAAGGGKSILGCYWQLKTRLKYPETSGLIGRASLKALKDTTLLSFFAVCKMQGIKAGIHYNYNQQSNVIHLFNGSKIFLKDLFLYPSDPEFDELGSLEITDAFLDEVSQISLKAKNIVRSRIRSKLDENGLIPKILMTCNPAKNWTYSEFYKANLNNTLPENKKFIQALLSDNPNISKHYRENLLSLDENSKQRLLYGNWDYDNDPRVLMPQEKILDIFTNTFVSAGIKYITCDVARFGRDKTVIGVWSGWRLFKVVVIDKSDLKEVKDTIETLRVEHEIPLSSIIVDEDGVGGGVVDFVRCKGFVNNSSPIKMGGKDQNFANLKSQCYFGLADRVNTDQIFISESVRYAEEIREELAQVKQKNMDKDGKRAVEGKDEMKLNLGRSPDFADMIMMRFWFDLKPKIWGGVV